MTLIEYTDRIKKVLKELAIELDDEDIQLALQNALSEMSRDIPLVKSFEYSVTGETIFDLPSDWDDGFSFIQCLEFIEEELTECLEESDYKITYQSGIPKLEIKNSDQIIGIMTLHYSVPYRIGESENNVKGSYTTALVWLAAAQSTFAISQKKIYQKQSDFNADLSLDSQSEKLLKLSDKYKEKYRDMVNKILFGSSASRAYLSSRSHNSDIFGDSKLFH